MSIKILSVEERLKTHTGVKVLICGKSGIGKTSLLKTLDEPTLCIDFEAGLLAVQSWDGDSISVNTWREARDLICWICGPSLAVKQDHAYGQKHFEHACKQFGDPSQLNKYKNIFIDSITEASRLCKYWAEAQPAAFSKTGAADKWSMYGLLKDDMILGLKRLQHVPNKNVILVIILEEMLDEFNRTKYVLQCEGSAIARELPGIVDQVISMVPMKQNHNIEERKFVCHTQNQWGYPAKDRSGCLDMFEPAHFGKLFTKIEEARRVPPITTKENSDAPTPNFNNAKKGASL